MTIKLGSDGFPKRGLSRKRQQEWLAANRPAGDAWFDANFYVSQSRAFTKSSILAGGITVACLAVALVAQVVSFILRVAS